MLHNFSLQPKASKTTLNSPNHLQPNPTKMSSDTKGYLLSSVLYEEVSATIEGLPRAKVEERMTQKLEEATAIMVPALEKLAAATTLDQADGAGYELQKVSLANNADNLEDWDFMVSPQHPFLNKSVH